MLWTIIPMEALTALLPPLYRQLTIQGQLGPILAGTSVLKQVATPSRQLPISKTWEEFAPLMHHKVSPWFSNLVR